MVGWSTEHKENMSEENENKSEETGGRRAPLGGDGPLIHPKKQSFLASLWSDFLAGVAVVAPIGITIWLFYLLFTGPMAKLDTFVKRTLPVGDSKYEAFVQFFPGFGVLLAFIAIILIGIFTKNFIGRSFIRAGERLFESLPIVRNVFGFFKNVFETALRQSDRSFKEVVEYPRKDAWVMAFVVGETKGEVLARLNDMGEQLTSIFIPTVPNPTSGFLLFVPRKDLRILSMSVEEAAKVVFSLGLVSPEFKDSEAAAKHLEALAEEARREKNPLKKRLFGSRKN